MVPDWFPDDLIPPRPHGSGAALLAPGRKDGGDGALTGATGAGGFRSGGFGTPPVPASGHPDPGMSLRLID